MPKMTVVTLPPTIVDTNQPRMGKQTTSPHRYLRIIFHKIYSILTALLYGQNWFVSMIAFLLGRVVFMEEFSPVGLAFFGAVAQINSKNALTVGVWTTLGVMASGNYYEVGIYIFSIGLYFWAAKKSSVRYKRIFIVPLLMFCGILCAGCMVSISTEATLYRLLLVLFEATTCMVLSYIFMCGVPFLTNWHTVLHKENVSSEGLICLVLVMAIAVAGLGDIVVVGYSIRNVMGSMLVMTMALVGSTGLSAVMGIVVGLIVGLSDGNTSLAISLYAVSGVLAGVVRGLGKFIVMIAFILGSTIILLYLGQDNELNIMLQEGIIAGGLFLLIPPRWLVMWQDANSKSDMKIEQGNSQLDTAIGKIKEISHIFNDLAVELNHLTTATKEKIHDDELAKTLSIVGEQVCLACEKRTYCWEDNFYRTYHGILALLEGMEKQSVALNQMPTVFQEHCIRCRELLEQVKSVTKENRTKAFWQRKIMDTRQILTDQIKATSSIIGGLAYEIGKGEYIDAELALNLQEKTAILGCGLENVQCSGGHGERVIEAWKKPCNGNRECVNTILPLVASLTKEKMIIKTKCGNEIKQQKCKLTMQVARRFGVETGMASLPKEEQQVCGDTCGVITLSQGKVALVLSDGMGSGAQAETQSKVAVDFLRKLLVAGFATDVAVKMINSMLLLRSPEESFVTIDMAVIDTYSGEVEFLKIGSAPSFIKRVREVATINSTSLPVGILEEIEFEPIKSVVVVDDFIIMVSDGIIDVPPNKFEKSNWLANFLRHSVNMSPQVLAERILTQARQMCSNQITDDMTVLVAKIIK